MEKFWVNCYITGKLGRCVRGGMTYGGPGSLAPQTPSCLEPVQMRARAPGLLVDGERVARGAPADLGHWRARELALAV